MKAIGLASAASGSTELREFAHILSVFPLVAEKVKSAALEEFRKRSIEDANDRNL